MQPRGMRNCNPGNIRKSSDKWQGLAAEQPDPYFFSFEDPVYGIRAMVKILWTYQDKYKIRSVDKLIRRWAPPSENNTRAYIQSVADKLGVAPDAEIKLKDARTLLNILKAIIQHENGQQPYGDDLILKAINLAEAQ